MEPTLAEIRLFAGTFAPSGWALCDGQILPINTNQALYSLLGTTYGGDGRTTFALPDFRGRFPVSPGLGPGLPDYRQGAKGGAETHALTVQEIPSHTHSLSGTSSIGSSPDPNGQLPAVAQTEVERGATPQAVDMYGSTPNVQLAADSVLPNGGNQALNIRNPFLGLNYIIALRGVFPSRS